MNWKKHWSKKNAEVSKQFGIKRFKGGHSIARRNVEGEVFDEEECVGCAEEIEKLHWKSPRGGDENWGFPEL